MINADTVLRVLLAMAPYHGDIETPAQREARLRVAAEAMVEVTGGRASGVAALIAVGKHESEFSQYVGEGRCLEGPAGQRCDNGLARQYWQVHKHCTALWEADAGSRTAVVEGARCAYRRLRWGYRVCRTDTDRFACVLSFYGRSRSDWAPGRKRVKTFDWALAKLATEHASQY